MKAAAALAHIDTHKRLNSLESAGWAVIAADHFGLCKGEAAVLRELALAGGRVVSSDHLAAQFRQSDTSLIAARRLSSRVGRIRAALEDVGFPRFALWNVSGVGYALTPHHARQIRAIVEGGE